MSCSPPRERPTTANHQWLYTKWKEARPPTVFGSGTIYRYNSGTGLWRQAYEHLLRREICRLIEKEGISPTARLINGVYALTKDEQAIDDRRFDAAIELLACANGTLHLETGQLVPHQPQHYLTTGVEFDYDSKAAAPAWGSYLSRLESVLSVEVVEFLQEFAGYCVTTDTHYEAALWLHGPPGCGKSTFINGLLSVLKHRACTLSLSDLERSRFCLTNLPGKTLALATEQPSRTLRAVDVLNKLISGEPLMVERKHQHPFDMQPTCKIIWAMNSLPRISEAASGIFRRVAVVKFPALPEGERDPNLRERIRQEGPGILNWMLVGLARLREKGKLIVPAVILRAQEEYQKSNDLERQWLEERCVRTGETAASTLYEDYKDWCMESGHRPTNGNRFASRLEDLGLTRRVLKGRRLWTGVSINHDHGHNS